MNFNFACTNRKMHRVSPGRNFQWLSFPLSHHRHRHYLECIFGSFDWHISFSIKSWAICTRYVHVWCMLKAFLPNDAHRRKEASERERHAGQFHKMIAIMKQKKTCLVSSSHSVFCIFCWVFDERNMKRRSATVDVHGNMLIS